MAHIKGFPKEPLVSVSVGLRDSPQQRGSLWQRASIRFPARLSLRPSAWYHVLANSSCMGSFPARTPCWESPSALLGASQCLWLPLRFVGCLCPARVITRSSFSSLHSFILFHLFTSRTSRRFIPGVSSRPPTNPAAAGVTVSPQPSPASKGTTTSPWASSSPTASCCAEPQAQKAPGLPGGGIGSLGFYSSSRLSQFFGVWGGLPWFGPVPQHSFKPSRPLLLSGCKGLHLLMVPHFCIFLGRGLFDLEYNELVPPCVGCVGVCGVDLACI